MRASIEYKRLEDVCELFADGDWIETKDQSLSGVRLIQTGNVGKGEFKNRGERARYISEDTFKRLRCTEIFEGDCLVSRLPDPVGRACLLPTTGERMITAVDCTIIRFRRNLIEPKYFHYFAQSHEYFRQVEELIGGATRQRISRSNLGNIILPCPPLSEQQRIVDILDETLGGLATATENAEKNLNNARELFDSHLNSVFGQNWGMQALGDISENLDSKRVPITKHHRKSGDIPYYGASGPVDCVDGFIFDEDLLLVSEDGANLVMRNYPIAFSIAGKSWVNNHAHVLRFSDLASQRFVEFYLNSISLMPYVSGMAQPKLNQRALNSIPVPWPKQDERENVVARIEQLAAQTDRLRELYETRISALTELKQSILGKAFSGGLTSRLSRATKEAAE